MELKKVIRLLSPLMVEGILSVRKNSHDRLVEKLHELEFTTRSIVKVNDQVIIKLQIIDLDSFYRLVAGEANKFLLASRVSNERSTQNQLNNASWQIIENYYAAYYGVHYLLRLTGISLTNIDVQGIRSIERSNYGELPNFSIPSGLYFMEYENETETLTLTKEKKQGGSHKDAWKLWAELVENLRVLTDEDPIEYASLSLDLKKHKQFIIKSPEKYNPPEIRGEINYQFRGGSWVFEKNTDKSISILQRSIAGAQFLDSSKALVSERLIANNKIIIDLAKSVFIHVSEKYPKSFCKSLSNKFKNYI